MKDKIIRVSKCMQESGVKFGTSGARGLAADMTDEICYAYTLAFLQYLEIAGDLIPGVSIALGGDLRPSTDRIMAAAAKAVKDKGHPLINCGKIPSPALAFYGLTHKIPSIMVTGSHIPEDRNGIKYNKPDGEVLKKDEAGIQSQQVSIAGDLFDGSGRFIENISLGPVVSGAVQNYIKRYTDFFPPGCLKGKKIGVYEHSSVAREVICEVMRGLGAEVTRLGFSETFIPVDTEAIRGEDVALAKQWSREHSFDSILSADGDGDRPLLSDEKGRWLRGDVAGILAAIYLGADAVVAPVSCNTAVEKCGKFKFVKRTRIGSPFVIEGMKEAVASGYECVTGYEANGGFLTNSPITRFGSKLAALPTRDAVILHMCILMLSIRQNKTISQIAAALPQRLTASDRLKEFPTELSRQKLEHFSSGNFPKDKIAIEEAFAEVSGSVASIDMTDGLRITFQNDEIIHLRPSGNAPEFRCYTEADSEARAVAMNRACMRIMASWRN